MVVFSAMYSIFAASSARVALVIDNQTEAKTIDFRVTDMCDGPSKDARLRSVLVTRRGYKTSGWSWMVRVFRYL